MMTHFLFGHAPRLAFGLFAATFGAQSAMAQTAVPSFALTGHIEKFSLDTPADKFSAAKITVRGIDVVLPKNLLITMPGQYLTAQDLFRGPTMQAPPQDANSGLALLDTPAPRVPFEVELAGNIVMAFTLRASPISHRARSIPARASSRTSTTKRANS